VKGIALRWKIIFTLFGIICALIAVMGLAAPGEKDWSFIALIGFFAFLLGVVPWLKLSK
jgi:hypothetical protein